MSDITYTIGAKDQASAPIKKVESSMERLEKSTKKLGETSEKSLGKIDVSFQSLLKGAGVIKALDIGVQMVGKAFSSAFGAISQGIDDFDAAEESMRSLNQAMELNGGASDELSQKYADLSDAIETRTNVAAEDVQALMKQAAVLGVNNEQLDDMAQAAIGVSEALGVSLEDGLKKVRLATEGNFASFEKLLPSIKTMATDEEKLAAVLELSARGMAMKEEASQSAGGEAERMNHRIGNLMETIGAALSPLREVMYKGVTVLADGLSDLLAPAVEFVRSVIERMEPVFTAMKDAASVAFQVLGQVFSTIATIAGDFIGSFVNLGDTFGNVSDFIRDTAVSVGNVIIGAVTMMEVTYNNLGAVIGIAFDSVLLSYETYRADTEHLFVTTIPAYLTWFGENFFNIIDTAFSAVTSIVTTHITKIMDTFSVLWDFISSGGSTDVLGQLGEIAGRSYLENFENTIGELPNVAARAMTDTERELNASIADTANKLAAEYDAKMSSRTVNIGGQIGEDMAAGIDLALKSAESKIVDQSDEFEAALSGLEKDKSTSSQSDAALQAVQSRLLTRGPGERKKDPGELLQQLVNMTTIANDQAMIAASELAQIRKQLEENPPLILDPVGL